MQRPIELESEFFEVLKKLIKNQSSKAFDLKEFEEYQSYNPDFQRARAFIENRVTRKEKTPFDLREKMKEWLRNKPEEGCFMFEEFKSVDRSTVYVRFYSNPKIKNEQDLLEQIDCKGDGLLLDEDLLNHTYPGIIQSVKSLIQRRECLPIRSKQVEKISKKNRDDNYDGVYLFPIPPELREPKWDKFYQHQLNQLQDKPEIKMLQKFSTKTEKYRRLYEEICGENLNRQVITRPQDNNQRERNFSDSISEINRNAIPDLQRYIEEYINEHK